MLIQQASLYLYYNSIYIFTSYLVLLVAISLEIKKNLIIQKKLSEYLVLLPIFLLIIISGFRSYYLDDDTNTYYIILWLSELSINFKDEFMFSLIAWILRYLGFDFTYFLLTVALIFYVYIYKAIKNHAEIYKANLLMVFFAYMSFFFFTSLSFNVIRQGVSLALLLYAYSLVEKNGSKIKITLYAILSIAFHTTSIIPIIIFLMVNIIQINRKKLLIYSLIIYIIALLLAYFNYGILNVAPVLSNLLVENRRSGYLAANDVEGYVVGFKAQFALFNTFFLGLALYINNKLTDSNIKNQHSILLLYYIIASAVFFLVFQIPYSDRWGLFSWCCIPFLLTPLFYSPYLKGKIKIHFIIMLLLIFMAI